MCSSYVQLRILLSNRRKIRGVDKKVDLKSKLNFSSYVRDFTESAILVHRSKEANTVKAE
ncbi:hypothetical protein KL86SPO_30063 [uncultured Sporomusa sp.]|uniref:Uncharacterized protein n=1 Tax=uncultured Sporomusa sp. TaxID=307249 RepID=A0A212LQ66_9FIRM|nr:hypothetical protein KL86SPO_30063 [uncultured Sporomusa sp.]